MKSWQVATSVFLLLLSLLSSRAGTLAQFRTVFGDVEVELYDQDKPVTVQNFIRYVQSGRYQDEFVHRLVPGFVAQGGGFTVTNRGTTNWAIVSVPTYPTITNEFAVGRRFSNIYGTIAMAKAGGNTNSASSQWFINLANNSFLDAADTNDLFVVFGHVVSGTNVLNMFNSFQYWTGAQSSNLVLHQYYQAPFDDLPLLYLPAVDTNLLFADITLLQVAVKPVAGGGKEISWNSATGMTNIVEFTTNLPPAWITLTRTNGTGARMTVVDSVASQRRFYRVRVTY
jgi:cyclophilin family peptidyl-prolyl cis-trans isomerase